MRTSKERSDVTSNLEAVRSEATRYIVGLITPHGILRLDTGRRYGRIAASLRAEELEATCEAEKNALEGIRFIALAIDSE